MEVKLSDILGFCDVKQKEDPCFVIPDLGSIKKSIDEGALDNHFQKAEIQKWLRAHSKNLFLLVEWSGFKCNEEKCRCLNKQYYCPKETYLVLVDTYFLIAKSLFKKLDSIEEKKAFLKKHSHIKLWHLIPDQLEVQELKNLAYVQDYETLVLELADYRSRNGTNVPELLKRKFKKKYHQEGTSKTKLLQTEIEHIRTRLKNSDRYKIFEKAYRERQRLERFKIYGHVNCLRPKDYKVGLDKKLTPTKEDMFICLKTFLRMEIRIEYLYWLERLRDGEIEIDSSRKSSVGFVWKGSQEVLNTFCEDLIMINTSIHIFSSGTTITQKLFQKVCQ